SRCRRRPRCVLIGRPLQQSIRFRRDCATYLHSDLHGCNPLPDHSPRQQRCDFRSWCSTLVLLGCQLREFLLSALCFSWHTSLESVDHLALPECDIRSSVALPLLLSTG